MKYLISINEKFFGYTPHDLINMIKKESKYTNGFEAYIDPTKPEQIKYLRDLAFECKRHNYHLQIHGNIENDLLIEYRYLDILGNVSNVIGYPIHIVYHSIFNENFEQSKISTIKNLASIIDYIEEHNYPIILGIENLNNAKNMPRLHKEDIVPILEVLDTLHFTYDLGHEIEDCGHIIDVHPLCLERLKNVHLHTYDYHADHKIILQKDMHQVEWSKAINFLKHIKYDGPIVLEYDLYNIVGDSLDEHLGRYIKSIDLIANYFE